MKTHAEAKKPVPSNTHAAPVPDALAHQAQLRGALLRAGVQPQLEAGAVNASLMCEAGDDKEILECTYGSHDDTCSEQEFNANREREERVAAEIEEKARLSREKVIRDKLKKNLAGLKTLSKKKPQELVLIWNRKQLDEVDNWPIEGVTELVKWSSERLAGWSPERLAVLAKSFSREKLAELAEWFSRDFEKFAALAKWPTRNLAVLGSWSWPLDQFDELAKWPTRNLAELAEWFADRLAVLGSWRLWQLDELAKWHPRRLAALSVFFSPKRLAALSEWFSRDFEKLAALSKWHPRYLAVLGDLDEVRFAKLVKWPTNLFAALGKRIYTCEELYESRKREANPTDEVAAEIANEKYIAEIANEKENINKILDSLREPTNGVYSEHEVKNVINSLAVCSEHEVGNSLAREKAFAAKTDSEAEAKKKAKNKNVRADDIKKLAAVAYGEASTDDIVDEIAGIAWAIANRARAAKWSISEIFKNDPNYAFAEKDRNARFKLFYENKDKATHFNRVGMSWAMESAENALEKKGVDPSNGAHWWDGKDFHTNEKHAKRSLGYIYGDSKRGSDSYHGKSIGVPEQRPVPGIGYWYDNDKKTGKKVKTGERGRYNHVYESTAVHGGTIFWKYGQAYMDATGTKSWQ